MENKICENSDQFFASYMSSESNNKCFDCGSPAPQWASISHGILICMNCTSIHRRLGVSVSQVRSINLDIWTEKHITMMRVGGNQQFQEYLEKYNLDKEQPMVKYQTKAAQSYRKRLTAMASNSQVQDEDLDYDEGRTMSDGTTVPTRSPQDIGNSSLLIEEELKDIDVHLSNSDQIDQQQKVQQSKQSGYFSMFKSKATSVFNDVSSSSVVQKASSSAKDIYNKAGTITKETSSKVKTKLDETGVTQIASSTAGKISTGGKFVGGFIVDKAKGAHTVVGQKIDQNEKLSNATKIAKEKASVLGNAVSSGVSGLFARFKKPNPNSANSNMNEQNNQPLQYEEQKHEVDGDDSDDNNKADKEPQVDLMGNNDPYAMPNDIKQTNQVNQDNELKNFI
eukprot:403348208